MAHSQREGGQQPGKILSLAAWITEHREAADYDLIKATGHTTDDIGGSLSWAAAGAVFSNLEPNSACGRILYPDEAPWGTIYKTNQILADIFDAIMTLNANVVAIGSGKKAKQPDPYPRPGDKKRKKKNTEEKHFGADPLPPDELRAWLEVKRAEAQLRKSQSV